MADTETREQKFVRLAQARVRKALNAIRLLENLSAYPHTHDHTIKIIKVLHDAVERVEYRLGGEKMGKKDEGFSFGEDDE